MNEEHVDLDKLMANIFGSQQSAEQQFYLWYNELNCIVGFAGNIINDYENYTRINIDYDTFEMLSADNIHNYIIDTTADPPVPVNINSNTINKNLSIPRIKKWTDNSLVKIQFVKQTRKLLVNVGSQLPAVKKVWIVPAGNYNVPLCYIELQQQGFYSYEIPQWLNSTSCWCISDQPIEIFTAYREVENEEDL